MNRSQHSLVDRIAKKSVQLAVIVFFILLGFVSYHQVMSGIHMQDMSSSNVNVVDSDTPSMAYHANESPACYTLCITVSQLYWDDLMQALYITTFALSSNGGMLFILLLASFCISYFALFGTLRDRLYAIQQKVHHLLQTYQFQLFSPIKEQYRTGIIAPKLFE